LDLTDPLSVRRFAADVKVIAATVTAAAAAAAATTTSGGGDGSIDSGGGDSSSSDSSSSSSSDCNVLSTLVLNAGMVYGPDYSGPFSTQPYVKGGAEVPTMVAANHLGHFLLLQVIG